MHTGCLAFLLARCQDPLSDAMSCSHRIPWQSLGTERPRRGGRTAKAVPDPLLPLGLDFLTFLAATVLVIPVFKSVKASPVLGFLFSGLVLGQLGCALPSSSLPALPLLHA